MPQRLGEASREGHEYPESVARLRTGDALVLYTHRGVEARNASGEEFHALRVRGGTDSRRRPSVLK